MEAIALPLALVVAASFLCDGVNSRHHHTKHNSAWPPSDHSDNVYDVIKDFGDVGDGVADDTEAIKTAWDMACQDDREGIVLAAAGHSFLVHTTTFTGSCQGRVTLQIDGTIVAPSEPATWPANSKRRWLVFYKADGLSLRGAGLIDGKGQKWWDHPCKPHKGGNMH